MAKKMYDILLTEITRKLSEIRYDLIGVDQKKQPLKDEDGNPTNKSENYSDYEIEVPRGYGAMSRRQASVKVIEDSSTSLDKEKLDEGIYQITFSGLTVSYLDPQRHAVYLRATGYEIIDCETGKVVSRRE